MSLLVFKLALVHSSSLVDLFLGVAHHFRPALLSRTHEVSQGRVVRRVAAISGVHLGGEGSSGDRLGPGQRVGGAGGCRGPADVPLILFVGSAHRLG